MTNPMSDDRPKRALNPEQVAEQLGIHPETVRQHLRAGLIPAVRIGRQWRILQTTVDAMLAGEIPAAK